METIKSSVVKPKLGDQLETKNLLKKVFFNWPSLSQSLTDLPRVSFDADCLLVLKVVIAILIKFLHKSLYLNGLIPCDYLPSASPYKSLSDQKASTHKSLSNQKASSYKSLSDQKASTHKSLKVRLSET